MPEEAELRGSATKSTNEPTSKQSNKKGKNPKSVALTADELRQQTSDQIGVLATSVSKPMMAAVRKTASQQIMLETVQSMPDILADANAGLEDFFGSFEPETLAFDLTIDLLPQSAQQALLAGS